MLWLEGGFWFSKSQKTVCNCIGDHFLTRCHILILRKYSECMRVDFTDYFQTYTDSQVLSGNACAWAYASSRCQAVYLLPCGLSTWLWDKDWRGERRDSRPKHITAWTKNAAEKFCMRLHSSACMRLRLHSSACVRLCLHTEN